MLKWCQSRTEFTKLTTVLEPVRLAEEAKLANCIGKSVFCRGCGSWSRVKVPKADCRSGQWANLLEGMSCEVCRLNGRMRSFCAVIEEILQLRTVRDAVIFEQVTPLFRILVKRVPALVGCEYLGSNIVSGTFHSFPQGSIRHEDICATSLPSDSLDLVMHCDVLEHVPDAQAALSECLRIMRPGGILAFTCPFYYQLTRNLMRAHLEDGRIKHLLPPAYHGNPVRETGALVYIHPGWETFDALREVGFNNPKIAVIYDPVEGVVTNGCPFEDGHVWSVVLVASKGSL